MNCSAFSSQCAVIASVCTGFRSRCQQQMEVIGHNHRFMQEGFTTHGVMTAQIALPGFRDNTDAKWMEFHLQLEQAMRGVPGVTAVQTCPN
jgi:hypothetical protein